MKEIAGRIPVIAGLAAIIRPMLSGCRRSVRKSGGGWTAYMLTPYYNKTSQEGLDRHFRACAHGHRGR